MYSSEVYNALNGLLMKETEPANEIRLYYREDTEAEDDSHKSEWSETFTVPHINKDEETYLYKILNSFDTEALLGNDLIRIDSQRMDPKQMSEHLLVRVDAGPYISSTDIAKGNNFYSSCDTYGPYYFSESYLYLKEEDIYIIVSRYYLAY